MPTPNIIYILADDMGYGDLGRNNPDSRIPTPNLNRLADQGMRFTNAHAPSSVCTPSRYAIMTGRYCWRSRLKTGIVWQWDAPLLESERPTVANILRDNGYRTACIGKWHLGWDWPLTDGSKANDHVEFGVLNHKYTLQNEADRQKTGKARCQLGALIDYSQPLRGGPIDHGFDSYFGDDVPNFPPYTWFENDRIVRVPTVRKPDDMFGAPGDMVPNWNLESVMPELTRRAVNYVEQASDDPYFLYFPLTAPHEPIVPLNRFRGMSQAGDYGDYVCEIDWCVGQIMEALDRTAQTDNTLLIFTSDNGPERFAYDRICKHQHYSMGDLRGLKRDAWEGGHRVPFVARWPGITGTGTTCEHLTTLGDLMATAADISGISVPKNAAEDSVSIAPLLHGGGPVRSCAVHHSMKGRFALRQDNWVFIDAPTGGDNEEPDWFRTERSYEPHDYPGELYNLHEDLGQRINRYGEEPERVAQMTTLLRRVQTGSDQSLPNVGL